MLFGVGHREQEAAVDDCAVGLRAQWLQLGLRHAVVAQREEGVVSAVGDEQVSVELTADVQLARQRLLSAGFRVRHPELDRGRVECGCVDLVVEVGADTQLVFGDSERNVLALLAAGKLYGRALCELGRRFAASDAFEKIKSASAVCECLDFVVVLIGCVHLVVVHADVGEPTLCYEQAHVGRYKK